MKTLISRSAHKLTLSLVVSLGLSACTTKDYVAAPLSAVDLAQKLHSQSLVLDAHADIVIESTNPAYLAADGSSKVSLDKLQAGGVGAVVMALAVGPGDRTVQADAQARTIVDEKLAAVQTLIRNHAESLVLARSSADLEQAQVNNKIAIILGFQNARSLQGNLDTLDELYDKGVRVFALNHLAHNDFADSSRPRYNGEAKQYEISEEHGGLSALGRAAVKRINALGGIVDISQLSKAAALQSMELSSAPVIASHSNVLTITNVSRNLSDQEIYRLRDNGGVIHVAAFGAYLVDLSKQETLDAIVAVRLKHGLPAAYSYPYELYWELADTTAKRAFLYEMRSTIGAGSVQDKAYHIDYIVNLIGVKHVGIGNDFNHGSGISGYADASESLNLTKELVNRGYTDAAIKAIWGGNFMRVFKQAEALKASASL